MSSSRDAIACAPQSPNALRVSRSARFMRHFRRDQRGNVAIIFALTSLVAVTLVGGAVDFGRVYSFKTKMQSALDAAALAGATFLMMDPAHDVSKAGDQASKYFNSVVNAEHGAVATPIVTAQTKTVSITADAVVPTPFLSLIGINSIPLNGVALATGTALIAGGSGQDEVELALMLDITGSMGESALTGGTKLDAMKLAAKDLIDILMPDNGGTIHAKVALAPFSARINAGDYAAAATGQPLVKTTTSNYQCNPHEVCEQVCTSYKKNGSCKSYDNQCTTVYDTCTSSKTTYLRRCMEERTGPLKFEDDTPGSGFPYTYVSNLNSATNCTPTQAIVPLTSDKTVLKDRITNFTASGSTAGHLGTAWAWYMLSPDWSGVFSGTAAPKAYNTPKLRKIAVLMTDGEYNLYYSSGQGDSTAQARSLCANMKAAGIEVFTVGFMLDTDVSKETMRQCASTTENAFLADNGQQLYDAFRAIAYKVVPIHLKK